MSSTSSSRHHPEESSSKIDSQLGDLDNNKVINIKDCANILSNLENCTDISEIEKVQKKLQQDYRALAKEFALSRISRVDAYLKKIEEIQANIRKNQAAYETYVKNCMPLLNEEYSTEDVSLQQQHDRLRKKFHAEDQDKDENPLDDLPLTPSLDELPIFPNLFKNVTTPYNDKLTTLRNEYIYQANLIESSTRKNVELIWRQNMKDLIDARKSRRNQTYKELYELEVDYYNVNKNAKLIHNRKRFDLTRKKSTAERGKKTINTTALEIANELQAEIRSKPSNITDFKQKPVSSLSNNEISTDLALMNSKTCDVKISTVQANYLYMEKQQKKSALIDQQAKGPEQYNGEFIPKSENNGSVINMDINTGNQNGYPQQISEDEQLYLYRQHQMLQQQQQQQMLHQQQLYQQNQQQAYFDQHLLSKPPPHQHSINNNGSQNSVDLLHLEQNYNTAAREASADKPLKYKHSFMLSQQQPQQQQQQLHSPPHQQPSSPKTGRKNFKNSYQYNFKK